MSSFHQSARRTKHSSSSFKEESNWWDDLPAVLSCPQCGKKAMRRVSGPCQLLDGTFLPELERFQCSSCKANFFDDKAMKAIDRFRQARRKKSAVASRSKQARHQTAHRNF
jgi:hypothetical protein